MARIIIADDDELMVDLVRATLESAGHVVGALYDGQRVARVTSLKQPDLVVLDCDMPGKSGVEALRDIRASNIGYDTPVLMLTALTLPWDEVIAFRAGASEYLTKPFDPDHLLAVVDFMLKKYALFHPDAKPLSERAC